MEDKNTLGKKIGNVSITVLIGISLLTFIVGFATGKFYMQNQSSTPVSRLVDSETKTEVEQKTTEEITTESITEEETTVATSKKKKKKRKLVALTFDDGPGRYTMELLDILEKNHAKATFFVCGTSLERNDAKKILKRMDSLQCDIGNHTVNHISLPKASAKKIKKEIEGVDKKVKKLTGHKTKFLRPPYGAGAKSKKLKKNVKRPMICWNVDTLDWKTKSKKKTIAKATKSIHDGDIILMHDIHPWTVKAVKKIIPKLRKQGFEFVTVSELAKYKKVKLKKGKAYYEFD